MFIFGARPEEMRERSARLVLRIEIQQIHRNLVFLEPFGKSGHNAGFADTTFTAHRENYSLFGGNRNVAVSLFSYCFTHTSDSLTFSSTSQTASAS
jgi:hypothetical protein